MAQKLKKYVRYDGNRQLVPGSMVERVKQPKGKWEELEYPLPDGCCIPDNPNNTYNRDGWIGNRDGEFVRAWPTYYLSDLYEPPASNGVMVLPIHSQGIASNYPGRTGTVPSQPQGAPQMYFNMVDANNISWRNTFLFNWLSNPWYDSEFKLTQNGVQVIYLLRTYVSPWPVYNVPFNATLDALYHDEVYTGYYPTPPPTMVLKYESMNGVAFNYKDPITLDFKAPWM